MLNEDKFYKTSNMADIGFRIPKKRWLCKKFRLAMIKVIMQGKGIFITERKYKRRKFKPKIEMSKV